MLLTRVVPFLFGYSFLSVVVCVFVFYFVCVSGSMSLAAGSSGGKASTSNTTIIIIVVLSTVGGVLVISVTVGGVLLHQRRRKSPSAKTVEPKAVSPVAAPAAHGTIPSVDNPIRRQHGGDGRP